MSLHSVTPLYQNSAINTRLKKQVYFKMDCYQPAGSFKIRGIGAVCQDALAQGKTRLISSSGGNAGYAAAYAGRKLATPVTVIVPNTTSATKPLGEITNFNEFKKITISNRDGYKKEIQVN